MVLLGLAPVAPSLQCPKPAIPELGLATTVTQDQTITYSDGYRTTAYLVYPTMTAPSCGWPLVVYVHGFPGSKSGVLNSAVQLAARGFAVWAYDVRGQGSGMLLNPPSEGLTFSGGDEKIDLAEQILFARANFPGIVDPAKTAVTGTSQGAITSWFAATSSEKTLVVPGRAAVSFPKIDAVSPHAAIGDVHEGQIQGGTIFLSQFAIHLFSNPLAYTPEAHIPQISKSITDA